MSNILSKEVRESVARLMATENIRVEHRQVQTACFDVKNRVLVLPVWKDNISAETYSMFIGHEVSHALHSTHEDLQSALKENKNLHTCINIVEDVRIEKMIINRFPGLARDFNKGYTELHEKFDFFGLNGSDISDYGLIDRINIHFKLNRHMSFEVPFSDEEKVWLDKIDNCVTFSDVINVAKELYADWEEQQQEQSEEQQQEQSEDQQSQSGEQKQQSSGKEGDSSESEEQSQSADGDCGQQEGQQDTSDSDSVESQTDSNEGEQDSRKVEAKSAKELASEKTQTISQTMEHMEETMKKLIDERADTPVYIQHKKLNQDSYIVDHKTVHRGISEHYNHRDRTKYYGWAGDKLDSFMGENKKVVSYLVKEFNQKKAAMQHKRTKSAKTGVINTNRLYAYKYTDDIFRRGQYTPDGKNHGLVMVFDMSGSMSGPSYFGTIQQTITLVEFCRKVGIPYDVYGFSDNGSSASQLRSHLSHNDDFSRKIERSFSLRNYFSSKMTTTEHKTAVKNAYAVALPHSFYSKNHWSKQLPGEFHLDDELRYGANEPVHEYLGGTPLNSTMLVLPDIIRNFREENKLDIVNFICLTDGDASDSRTFYNNQILQDGTKSYHFEHRSDITSVLLKRVKELSGVNAVCFHLTDRPRNYIRRDDSFVDSVYSTYSEQNEFIKSKESEFRKDGFSEISAKNRNYDLYFLVKPEGLVIDEDEELEIDYSKSRRAQSTSIAKQLTKGTLKRVMLRKFIDLISVQL